MSNTPAHRRIDLLNQLHECSYDLTKHYKIVSLLRSQYITAGNTSFGYRTINHWEEKGLISNSRNTGKGWRKFCISEITFLAFADELRQIGYSIDLLKKVKSLFCETNGNGDDDYYLWEKALIYTVTHSPLFIKINKEGNVALLTEKMNNLSKAICNETAIIVPLTYIMEKSGRLKPVLMPIAQNICSSNIEYYELVVMTAMGLYDEIRENPDSDKPISHVEQSKALRRQIINSEPKNLDLIWNGNVTLKYRSNE